MGANTLILNKKDNVAVVLDNLKAGEKSVFDVPDEGVREIDAAGDIPVYHKIAVTDIQKGDMVYKYGQVIGRAVKDIKAGQHVHSHNLVSIREYLD